MDDNIGVLLESDLGKAIASTSTSAQWSTLEAFSKKVNKRLTMNSHGNNCTKTASKSLNPSPLTNVSLKDLDNFLISVGDSDLTKIGVFRHSFGNDTKCTPLILVNPAYGRAMRVAESNGNDNSEDTKKDEYTCTCCTKDSSEYNSTASEKKYFHSQEYNAGRHSSTQSKHKLNCLRWNPPNTGHLHSWRRGFTNSGKE